VHSCNLNNVFHTVSVKTGEVRNNDFILFADFKLINKQRFDVFVRIFGIVINRKKPEKRDCWAEAEEKALRERERKAAADRT
jgi:hypothetical protein